MHKPNLRPVFGRIIFSLPEWTKAQEMTQRLIRGPRQATVTLDNNYVFECLTAEKYYWFGRTFEREFRAAMEAALGSDDILYDVGAHAGFWCLAFAKRCKQIIAFEPSRKNRKRLEENVARNSLSNVAVVPYAVSDSDGPLSIMEGGSFSHIGGGAGAVPVQAITLDQFLDRYHYPPPTVIKLDIEGYAGKCCAGAQAVLRERPKLLIEIHHDAELEEVRVACAPHSYRFEWLEKSRHLPRHIIGQ